MNEETSSDLSPNPTIRKFNPGTFQSDEEVIRQFVVRERELGIVLDVLRGNVETSSCQHILLVAPRGRGKTMLLARVVAELRTNNELSQRLHPVRFMEESHEILDIADFWLETLFYLSKEMVRPDPGFAQELQTVHAELAGQWQGEFLAERARAAVLDASDRLGRKLVLMIENMQTLLDNVDDDFGWQLRETLQTEPQVILLGTATSRFERLDDVREPFFGLFRMLDLKPLDAEACRRLWQVVSGDVVSERRIKPLQILTGGSPRLMVIVAEFGRHRSLHQLMEELVSLVDDHSEYFRGHLEVLAPTERRVYLAAIDLWQPSSTSEIAARARMDVRSVSSLLGRLIDRGAVIVQGTGRKRFYSAAERLYSIYYKIRRERNEAAVVHNLIRFMAGLYSEDELKEMSDKLRLEAAQSPSIREGLKRVRAEFPRLDHILNSMETTAEDSKTGDGVFEDGTSEKPISEVVLTKLEELFSEKLSGLDHEQLEKVLFESLGGDHELVIANLSLFIRNFVGSTVPKFQVTVAIAMQYKGYLQMRNGDYDEALDSFDKLIERFGDNSDPVIQMLVSDVFVRKTITQLELSDADEILVTYDEMVTRPGITSLSGFQAARDSVIAKIMEKGFDQFDRGDFKASVTTLGGIVLRFGNSEEQGLRMRLAYVKFITACSYSSLGDNSAALAMLEDVIKRYDTDNSPDLGNLAIRALVSKAQIQIDGGHAKEALHTCDEGERTLRTFQGDEAILLSLKSIRVRALLGQKRHQAAMDEFRSVYEAFDPENGLMMRSFLQSIIMIFSSEGLRNDIIEILGSDSKKAEALNPLFVALRKRLGEKSRAPAEVLEVASDILAEIDEAQAS